MAFFRRHFPDRVQRSGFETPDGELRRRRLDHLAQGHDFKPAVVVDVFDKEMIVGEAGGSENGKYLGFFP